MKSDRNPKLINKKGLQWRTVLLVDDDAVMRKITARILRGFGCRVISVHCPADAEIFLSSFEGDIDLVVSDIDMPGMNGPSMVNRLITLGYTAPVLFISGSSDIHLDDYSLGHVPLLAKPFTAVALHHVLQQIRHSFI